MTISPGERGYRAALPVLRLMLGYMPLSTMRWLQHQGELRARLPPGVARERVSTDGVSCEWLIPTNSSSDQVLLYLHGGGFVYGWTDTHRQMVIYLARVMGMRALAVDYRLAPEHPFPAALDDCVTAYRWLLKQGVQPQNIVVAGDSAGGNLALTILLKLRQDGDPLPAAAACLSPATDVSHPDDAFPDVYDPILHRRAIRNYRNSYVADHDPRDPLMSPVYADLHGLPPLLIHIGEDEFLRFDAVRFADLAKQAGVDVRLEMYPRMWHVWQLMLAAMPQATQSLNDIGQFLKSHVGVLETQSSS